jgi:segregation and condensation protein A
MTLSLAQNAIAMLIDLAERGEIDPWDVQVIEVIDRFLSKLKPTEIPEAVLETGRAPYEADLFQSGQAFLYASILLLLKADSLARLESDQANETEETPEFLDDVMLDRPLLMRLEQQIRRRATAPPVQRRQVTLQELIAQLNLIATTLANPKPRHSVRRPRPQSRTQAMRTIAQLAHEENLSEIAAVLETFLAEHWQEFSEEQEWLDFDTLLTFWSAAQTETPSRTSAKTKLSEPAAPTIHDRVGVFWALLFLSAQSKVELAQQEFYQDLSIRSLVAPTDAANSSDAALPPLD